MLVFSPLSLSLCIKSLIFCCNTLKSLYICEIVFHFELLLLFLVTPLAYPDQFIRACNLPFISTFVSTSMEFLLLLSPHVSDQPSIYIFAPISMVLLLINIIIPKKELLWYQFVRKPPNMDTQEHHNNQQEQ